MGLRDTDSARQIGDETLLPGNVGSGSKVSSYCPPESDLNLKAFLQPSFNPGHKLRGRKNWRWPRRSMVVLSRHHEFLPVGVKPELEQRAALLYLRLTAASAEVAL